MNNRELIEKDDKEEIAKAVAEGFDPNGKDETLLPWLIVAVRCDAFNALDGLLAAGAKPEGPEGDPLSPLMVAIKMKKLQAVDLLLRHGANPNRPLPKKQTALHLATQDLPILDRLLAADAKVGVVDEQGWTPLMKAASEGSAEAVSRLLKAGADKEVADKQGRKAWDLAKAANHQAACDSLGAPAPVVAAPPPPAPMLRPNAPTPAAKPTTPGKPKRPALLEKYDSEPVKPWQAGVVVSIGLVLAVLIFFGLQNYMTSN